VGKREYICKFCGKSNLEECNLTDAQVAINELVLNGWTNRRIAYQLEVSYRTVSNWRKGRTNPNDWILTQLKMM
jgi:DNA-binding NarL/FixJ family response regulator